MLDKLFSFTVPQSGILWLFTKPSKSDFSFMNQLERTYVMIYFKAYNQSKFKSFLISIFFLLFMFSCNSIKKEDEKRPSGHIRAGNAQAAGTMKT
jgi:hypothetical protein